MVSIGEKVIRAVEVEVEAKLKPVGDCSAVHSVLWVDYMHTVVTERA